MILRKIFEILLMENYSEILRLAKKNINSTYSFLIWHKVMNKRLHQNPLYFLFDEFHSNWSINFIYDYNLLPFSNHIDKKLS